MEKDNRLPTAELIETAAAVGLTVAATSSASAALAAAGLSLFPKSLGLLVDRAVRWKEADAAAFWKELVNGHDQDGTTAEEIAGLLEAHADEPFVRENILRSVKTIMDSVDPCVIVPLATLVRHAIKGKVRPDAFTRNAMRLLADVGRDEMDDLRRLLAWALFETTTQQSLMIIATNMRQIGNNEWEPIPWVVKTLRDPDPAQPPNQERNYVYLPGLENPPRVFHLLRTNGLAMEKSGISFASGPNTVVIERVIVERLNNVIRLA